MDKKIIGVDVDGVIANLHYRWLELYNQDYKDGLCVEDITRWDTHEFVKPDCGHKIYDYLSRPDMYDKVPVIAGAKRGVDAIRAMGHRVVFVTANAKGMTDPKWNWLELHGFLPVRKSHQDLVIAHDKSLINVDVLVDDKLKHIRAFPRKGILFDAPWNRHEANGECVTGVTRAISWFDVVNYFDHKYDN